VEGEGGGVCSVGRAGRVCSLSVVLVEGGREGSFRSVIE
jgi:hypothetical protein